MWDVGSRAEKMVNAALKKAVEERVKRSREYVEDWLDIKVREKRFNVVDLF